MARIIVLGCAGSGKTYLSTQLARHTGSELILLDELWRPEWSESDLPEFRRLVSASHQGEHWISDGNFAAATFDLRLPRATLIVWLDRPRSLCTWRALKRLFTSDSRHRINSLQTVLRYIWRFKRVNVPIIEAERLIHGPAVPIRTLRTDRQVAEFISTHSHGEL